MPLPPGGAAAAEDVMALMSKGSANRCPCPEPRQQMWIPGRRLPLPLHLKLAARPCAVAACRLVHCGERHHVQAGAAVICTLLNSYSKISTCSDVAQARGGNEDERGIQPLPLG